MPNTAYSAAKFAVRGFTEALIEDLRVHAPHVRVALVLPGHVGTGIMANTRRVHGQPGPEDVGPAELAEARAVLGGSGLVPEGASDEELRQLLTQMENDFKDKAPVTAAQAATTILDGVRSGAWRILIGQDAAWLDRLVRARPEVAYDYEEFFNEAAVAEYTSAAQAAARRPRRRRPRRRRPRRRRPRRRRPRRRLRDPERVESFGRFGLDRDVVDHGVTGAVAGPVHQAVDVLGRSLEDRFDPAVGQVADPSGHAVFLGEAPAGVAEEDTLDPAGDQDAVADHRRRSPRRSGAVSWPRPGGRCRGRSSAPRRSARPGPAPGRPG